MKQLPLAIRTPIVAILMAVLAGIGVANLVPSPAEAAFGGGGGTNASAGVEAGSYLYNQSGPTVSVLCYTGCGGVAQFKYMYNYTGVSIFCYFDGNWFTGNYSSPRWFLIQIPGFYGLWQVHSSYVYYQTASPRC